MPNFAHLEAELKCFYCHASFIDLIYFQWGLCAGLQPRPERIYHLGDPIRWRYCKKDGTILAWTYFNDTGEGNLGDPEILNLIALERRTYFYERAFGVISCKSCKREFEGAAIEIRNGIIKTARVYLPGEFDPEIALYTIERDGLVKPRSDWFDHHMSLVMDSEDCINIKQKRGSE